MTLKDEVAESIHYRTVTSGSERIIDSELPILLGEICKLPEELQGIIVISDLQGVVAKNNENVLFYQPPDNSIDKLAGNEKIRGILKSQSPI